MNEVANEQMMDGTGQDRTREGMEWCRQNHLTSKNKYSKAKAGGRRGLERLVTDSNTILLRTWLLHHPLS